MNITILSDKVLELNEQFHLTLTSTNDSRLTIDPERKSAAIEIVDTSG